MRFTAWRIAAYDTSVRTIPSRRAGRYNLAGDPPTQYLSLHPWGPWAEVLRWEDRRSTRDAEQLSTRTWALDVTVTGPVETFDFDVVAAVGADPAQLVSEDYTECQALAAEARARGVAALVVPSAALPGTDNLVLLGPRVMTAWAVPPIDDIDVPASVVADRAGTPLAVLPFVRWRGEPHAGLDAWRHSSQLVFEEPVPTAV